MVLRRFLLFADFLVAAIVGLAVTAPAVIIDGFERAGSWLWDCLTRLIPAFAGFIPNLDTDSGLDPIVGNPLDAALMNSLRHEAGMRPLRC
jgi:hypothetical protein